MYNFHKIKNKEGYHEFLHENFKKGAIDGLKFITRKMTEAIDVSHPDTKDQKSLLIENNRLKKQMSELDETLRIVSAQTKLVIDTNKDLIYKIYKSKTENDIKIRKLLFLYFSMMTNYQPELITRVRNSFFKNAGMESQKEDLVFNMQNINQFVKSLSQQIFFSSEREETCITELMELFLEFHNTNEPLETNRFTMDQLLQKMNLNISLKPIEEGGYTGHQIGFFSQTERMRDNESQNDRISSVGINSIYEGTSVMDFDLGNFKLNTMSGVSREHSVGNYDEESIYDVNNSSFNLKTPQSERFDKQF